MTHDPQPPMRNDSNAGATGTPVDAPRVAGSRHALRYSTGPEIVRCAIPDADDELCSHVLWGRTAFPFTRMTARTLYRAASRVRRAKEHGIELCTFCDRIAEPNSWECKGCSDALNAATADAARTLLPTPQTEIGPRIPDLHGSNEP